MQNSVYLNRRFNCSASALFQWLVEPELIIQWFGPSHLQVTNVKTDIKVGGTYSIKLSKPDGTFFFIEGDYIEITEPLKLIFNLAYRGTPNNPPDSLVEINLKEVDEDTTDLSLIQKFAIAPDDMVNRTKAWEHMFTTLQILTKPLSEHN